MPRVQRRAEGIVKALVQRIATDAIAWVLVWAVVAVAFGFAIAGRS